MAIEKQTWLYQAITIRKNPDAAPVIAVTWAERYVEDGVPGAVFLSKPKDIPVEEFHERFGQDTGALLHEHGLYKAQAERGRAMHQDVQARLHEAVAQGRRGAREALVAGADGLLVYLDREHVDHIVDGMTADLNDSARVEKIRKALHDRHEAAKSRAAEEKARRDAVRDALDT